MATQPDADDPMTVAGNTIDELIDEAIEQRFGDAEIVTESTDSSAKAALVDRGTSFRDPVTGMNITVDTEEARAEASEQGLHLKYQRDALTWDSGNVWGDGIQVSAHAGELWAEGEATQHGTQLGAHADIAGADVRVGSDQNNLKVGLSAGEGLGLGYQTGGDSDGDGYEEWGMSGEGGPLSVSFKVEPGYVADQAVASVANFAATAADDPLAAAGAVLDTVTPDPIAAVEYAAGVVERGATGWTGVAEQMAVAATDAYGEAAEVVTPYYDSAVEVVEQSYDDATSYVSDAYEQASDAVGEFFDGSSSDDLGMAD